MSEIIATGNFDVAERRGPAGRLVLRGQLDDRVQYLVIAGYAGPELPQALTSAAVHAVDGSAESERTWRLTSSEGTFDFRARTVECVEECPALYVPLHERFALGMTDRMALRALMGMLRLPGGARLLRLWHSRRRS